MSRASLRFRVKNVLRFKYNHDTFSRKQNTPRTSREGNRMIFTKEVQTIVSFSGDFARNMRKNLTELQSICILAIRCQTYNTLFSLRELVKQC